MIQYDFMLSVALRKPPKASQLSPHSQRLRPESSSLVSCFAVSAYTPWTGLAFQDTSKRTLHLAGM